ncbi:MAG: hypothetical protein LUB59_00955 [Candidatus Gastranaerophilales bacterium]|nr:hypothetical protein [Candidatus Gastranaerophilales bacterium]
MKETGEMDNFHFIDVKPAIDHAETASIKDTIFRRAREKSNTLAAEKGESYTSDIQNDVMSVAHESIQGTQANPFNRFIESMGLNNEQTEEVSEAQPAGKSVDIQEIYTREIKRNIESVSNEAFAGSVKNETMAAARNQFSQATNLTATLNFLNTQAAIRMAEGAHSKINFLS